MKWLSIDPGTKSCGVALWEGSELIQAYSLDAENLDPVSRIYSIVVRLPNEVYDRIVMEDPMMQGVANKTMQRFIGACTYHMYPRSRYFDFVHPMTVKKCLGSGSLDKEAVYQSLFQFPLDKKVLNGVKDDYDASDAIAIGITWLQQSGHVNFQLAPKKETKKNGKK